MRTINHVPRQAIYAAIAPIHTINTADGIIVAKINVDTKPTPVAMLHKGCAKTSCTENVRMRFSGASHMAISTHKWTFTNRKMTQVMKVILRDKKAKISLMSIT